MMKTLYFILKLFSSTSKERDDTILTLQSKLHQMEAEQTFFKSAQSPEDRSRQLEIVSEDLKQTKETLALQNEDIERMQNLLQHKDDEIDKLREVLDEDETNGSVSCILYGHLYRDNGDCSCWHKMQYNVRCRTVLSVLSVNRDFYGLSASKFM